MRMITDPFMIVCSNTGFRFMCRDPGVISNVFVLVASNPKKIINKHILK